MTNRCPKSIIYAIHTVWHSTEGQIYFVFLYYDCKILLSDLIVLSELPLTTSRSLYCRHAIPRLCPFRVLTNSHVEVFHTLMVRSPEAETIYFSSKSTTFTAARCPTSTRRNVISVCDVISHTAIDRSCNTIWLSVSPSTSAAAKNIFVHTQTPEQSKCFAHETEVYSSQTFAVHTWNFELIACVHSMYYCKPLYQLINPNPLPPKEYFSSRAVWCWENQISQEVVGQDHAKW